MWLSVTDRRKKYLVDHLCDLLGFMQVGIAEPETKDGDLKVDENSFLYRPTSSDVEPLEEPIMQIS